MKTDKFIKAGFTKFSQLPKSHWAKALFQKRIYDENGNTKYFINVYHSSVIHDDEFTTKVLFYRGDQTYELILRTSELSSCPEYVQGAVEKFWQDNLMGFDKHNN